MIIRSATSRDAEDIARIYNHYVLNTIITFEETEISTFEMAERISSVLNEGYPWYVVEHYDKNETLQTIGYSYGTRFKDRAAFRNSVETSIYLAPTAIGKGIGTRLYRTLILKLSELQFHVAIGGIALPNQASISLHERLGMKKVAHFEEVGFKFGTWIDVGYWQMQLR